MQTYLAAPGANAAEKKKSHRDVYTRKVQEHEAAGKARLSEFPADDEFDDQV